MATATIRPLPLPFSNRIVPVNAAPRDFDPEGDLPEGFLAFLAPLHAAITLRQRALVARRENTLAEAHAGKLPSYVPPSDRKSTRLNSSHGYISYAVFCL